MTETAQKIVPLRQAQRTSVVLHVEDDPNDVLLVQRAFKRAGSPVKLRSVQDGDSAVAYFEAKGKFSDRNEYPLPGLVLLDLKLPRRSGFEVLAWIRAHPDFSRTPVCILTSSRHDRDINLAYDHGTNSYLVKPVGFDDLVETIQLINSYWFSLNEPPRT